MMDSSRNKTDNNHGAGKQHYMFDYLENIYAYCPASVIDFSTGKQISQEQLSKTLTPSLAELELSDHKRYCIPQPVRDIYARYRPTPLFKAAKFERAIGTDCQIYIKDEGHTPTGNHKANSAFLIAYLCKCDGVHTIVTETTGNWGLALAMASKEFGLTTICFMDTESDRIRPDRKALMEQIGAKVIIVEQNEEHHDLLSLSADAAIKFTRDMPNAVYIFGSVYNYFITPQTIIGIEAKDQMGDKYPDIVVGSCGGGANLLGTAATFIVDILETGHPVEIFCAESEHCPILSRGKMGMYSVDNQGYYPLIKTYGLDGIGTSEYIGGLGSTIVASPVAYLHSQGLIGAKAYRAQDAQRASKLFYEAEGKAVALETGYQLAAVIEKARQNTGKIILVNISSQGFNSSYA